MKRFTFSKTLSSTTNEQQVTAETYSGLGTSLEGDTIPTGLLKFPTVIVANNTNRRLEAKNVSLTGFDVYGDMTGTDPPYIVTYLITTYG